jgi:hypothetical protein
MKQFLFLLFPLMVYSQVYQVKVIPIGNKEANGNINVATITLVFEPNSIGKDFEAAQMVAKNEALRIGADSITFISSTVYSSKIDQSFQGSEDSRVWVGQTLAIGTGATNSKSNAYDRNRE